MVLRIAIFFKLFPQLHGSVLNFAFWANIFSKKKFSDNFLTAENLGWITASFFATIPLNLYITSCLRKTMTLLFFKELCKTLVKFDKFWYAKSRNNLT